MNSPTFKINGYERRLMKKELSSLKSIFKNYFYYHQLDKDMGGDYVMDDETALSRYYEIKTEIDKLEYMLSIPYHENIYN